MATTVRTTCTCLNAEVRVRLCVDDSTTGFLTDATSVQSYRSTPTAVTDRWLSIWDTEVRNRMGAGEVAGIFCVAKVNVMVMGGGSENQYASTDNEACEGSESP